VEKSEKQAAWCSQLFKPADPADPAEGEKAAICTNTYQICRDSFKPADPAEGEKAMCTNLQPCNRCPADLTNLQAEKALASFRFAGLHELHELGTAFLTEYEE